MAARAGGVYIDVSPELAPGFAADSEALVRRGLDGLDDVARRIGGRMGERIGDGLDEGGRRGAAQMEDSFERFTRGADGRLRDSLGRFVSEARAAGDDAGEGIADGMVEGVEDAADSVGSSFGPAGVVGGAILAGIALVGAKAWGVLQGSMEREVDSDALAFRLGLDPGEQARLGAVAGRVYSNAYGESIQDVNVSVEAVRSTLAEVLPWTEDALERTTVKVIDLAKGFGIAEGAIAQSARILMDNGASVEEAFDLIYIGLTRMPAEIRDELLEISNEYLQFGTALGLTPEQMISSLVSAADKGTIVLDKWGDAIKEFGIRAADGSEASATAFEAAGLEANEYFDVFSIGGEVAEGALAEVAAGLLSIEDPSDRAAAAIALFGTPVEDLGTDKIPEFLQSLVDMEEGFGDTTGALDKAGAQMGDNAATWWETLKRGFMEPFNDFVDNSVTPRIGRLAEAFKTDGFEGLGAEWSLMWENEIKPGVDDALAKFGVWWEETGKPWISERFSEWVAAGTEWVATEGVPLLVAAGVSAGNALLAGVGQVAVAATSAVWEPIFWSFQSAWNGFANWFNSLSIPRIGPWTLTGPFGWSVDIGPWGPFDITPMDLPTMFTGGGGGATGGGGGAVKFMEDGGFLTGPTMIRADRMAGEAGPEVVVPLDRFETWYENLGGRGRHFQPSPAREPAVMMSGRKVGQVTTREAVRQTRMAS